MTTPSLEDLAVCARGGDRQALDALVGELVDDIYRLAFRMLGLRAEAEDATQEILIKVITHLGQFRGESSLRTWVWSIATRHVLARKRGAREEVASFDTIERLLAEGDRDPPQLPLTASELATLEEEVRLSCTQAMVMSLDREHRLAWILAEVFELDSDTAAAVSGIEPATHRKRLSRARKRLGDWLEAHCGLSNPARLCRCRRQIPVATGFGVVSLADLQYTGHPARPAQRRRLPLADEATLIERAADVLTQHAAYVAPAQIAAQIRALIASGTFRMFDA